MKLLIAYILAATTSLMADTVTFGWRANDEPFLLGYKLYISDGRVVDIFAPLTRVAVQMQPHQSARLTAYNVIGESDATPTLTYKPVVIEATLQQSKDLVEWGGRLTTIEALRVDETLFNPIMLQMEQRLNMTRTCVEMHINGKTYEYGVPTSVGKKFFRSFVASRPL